MIFLCHYPNPSLSNCMCLWILILLWPFRIWNTRGTIPLSTGLECRRSLFPSGGPESRPSVSDDPDPEVVYCREQPMTVSKSSESDFCMRSSPTSGLHLQGSHWTLKVHCYCHCCNPFCRCCFQKDSCSCEIFCLMFCLMLTCVCVSKLGWNKEDKKLIFNISLVALFIFTNLIVSSNVH